VIGLAEVDEFEGESSMGHDVAGLEIEMGYFVFLEVPECLSDHVDEVQLGVEGQRVCVLHDVVAEVGRTDVIYQQIVLVGMILFGEDIVLW
jgi:hypothetical protein